ncbi:MAG: amidophosphoribosyltransferase, partial [Leptospiraceae bacterium]|nr:amidophosphoribosyltransferase [Leptospiraceae bacterium]
GIREYLGVESLAYLSLDSALDAMHHNTTHPEQRRHWCTACFSGQYPIDVKNHHEGNQKDLFTEYQIEDMV